MCDEILKCLAIGLMSPKYFTYSDILILNQEPSILTMRHDGPKKKNKEEHVQRTKTEPLNAR